MTERPVVLVVDDDHRVRSALAGLLAATEEVSVLAVSSGEVATAEPSAALTLAIVDVPEVADAALDLVTRLSRRLPVIAVSMRGSMSGPALAAGAAAFVEKSGDPSAIHDAIVVVMAGPREEPSA